jgi:solute:Na+ symporter, SSS family
MGSALSAVFTRDVYARLIAPDRSDAHYVIVGRIATAGVLLIGFAYLPFIWKQEHMLKAFTTLIPVFVTPLFTVYMLGVLTRVHRRSGIIGLLSGAVYGVIALCDRQFYDVAWLPTWLTERWVAYSWSILFTLVPMVLVTLVLGAEDKAEEETWSEKGWLQRSREELPPFSAEDSSASRIANWLAVGLLIFCGWVTLVWFW